MQALSNSVSWDKGLEKKEAAMKFSHTHINRFLNHTVFLVGILSLLLAVVAPISRYSPTQVVEAAGEALAPTTAPDEATRARITEALGKLPLSFEANKG